MKLARCASLVWAVLLTGCATAGRRATIFYTSVIAAVSPKDAIVDIDRRFLEQYKDRVTIGTDFIVDNAMRSPNPKLLDGDLHIAGRAPEIGFRLVAEIKNADSAPRAMAIMQRAESTHAAVPVVGVWRLWPEHTLIPEDQRDPVPVLKTPNPDHIFEIHPVIRAGNTSVLNTLHPVEGYRPGNAQRTFHIYEGAQCALEVHPATIRLTLSNWLYNDVHFLFELATDPPLVVPGGRFVKGNALDTDGNQLVEGLRMVLVESSAPERAIRALRPGGRLHVWGLPRVSFAELSQRIAQAETNPAALKGKLPYEIIVLGVYADEK